MYTIEFQKCGLTPDDIDKVFSAKISCPITCPKLHQCVLDHMIHGPCGTINRSFPCMKNGKCSRLYLKNFQNTTSVSEDGYPHYRRRNDSLTMTKNGVCLDNRSVVPYNPELLLKYQAHINVEWCNRITSIKYLFKYINKGYDRITAAIVPQQNEACLKKQLVDEIKQYLDYRYVSPCEACWTIFSFPIHGRNPAVERLFFHLPGEQALYFKDDDEMDDIVGKATVSKSMFIGWMECNKKYAEARKLTYVEFVSKFVYVKKDRCWKPRKTGNTIGRLIWVPPSTGEVFYLRRMLTHVKGATSYIDIRTVNNVTYSKFREACLALGILTNDTEHVEAIKEAKDWGSGHYLRKQFVTIMLSNSINHPEDLWNQTWEWLADGILYRERNFSEIAGYIYFVYY